MKDTMQEHENVAFIEQLFYEQIKKITMQSAADSFEVQHSDAWVRKEVRA